MFFDLLIGSDGKLLAYTFPGGYELTYLAKDNSTLCHACANKEEMDVIVGWFINWEDTSLFCDECSRLIASQYSED